MGDGATSLQMDCTTIRPTYETILSYFMKLLLLSVLSWNVFSSMEDG